MKAVVFLCVVMGFFWGLATLLVFWLIGEERSLALALLSGILYSALLFVCVFVDLFVSEKRWYAQIEKGLSRPIVYKTRGEFDLGNGRNRNGIIYFTEMELVFISMDAKRDHFLKESVLKSNIEEMLCDSTHFNIRTKDGEVYIIKMPDAHSAATKLTKKGWL